MVHEKELQKQLAEKAEHKAREQGDLYVEQAHVTRTLTEEVGHYREEVLKLKKAIFQLEKDRERLGKLAIWV